MATDRHTAARLDKLEANVAAILATVDPAELPEPDTEPDDAPEVSERMTRAELDRIATDVGVPAPGDYPTKATLIAAIEQAGA